MRTTFAFSEDGIIELGYITDSPTVPSIIAGKFVEQDFFDNVTYEGFETDDEDEGSGTGMFIDPDAEPVEEEPLVVIDPVTGEEIVVEPAESRHPKTFTITLQVRGKLQEEAMKGGEN